MNCSSNVDENDQSSDLQQNQNRKFSTWSSDDDDDDWCSERQKRGSSFSLSSLASRSSTLSRLFKLTTKNIEPRKKSVSSDSIGRDDVYVAQPTMTSLSSPSTPMTSSTLNRKSRLFENSQNYPKFTFRRDSSEASTSIESLDDRISGDTLYNCNNSGKSSFEFVLEIIIVN